MAGWDGSGNFVLPYSMVAESAAGIKILSAHQDTQWQAVQVGLENCMTLDGQTKPIADISLNGHKITNLAAPAATTDAATKTYVDTAVATIPVPSEWTLEGHAVAWVSGTSFKVTGINVTALYHAGRRVKVVHNGGATTTYGTVVSSVFGVDTTVTVAMDGAVVLVSTVTAVSYGLLSYINPSYLDPRTAISCYLPPAGQAFTSGAPAKVQFSLKNFDVLSEFDAVTNFRFTPKYPGIYQISYLLLLQQTNAGVLDISCEIAKNGGIDFAVSCSFGSQVALASSGYMISKVRQLVAGDYLEFFINANQTGTVLGNVGNSSFVDIVRIA